MSKQKTLLQLVQKQYKQHLAEKRKEGEAAPNYGDIDALEKQLYGASPEDKGILVSILAKRAHETPDISEIVGHLTQELQGKGAVEKHNIISAQGARVTTMTAVEEEEELVYPTTGSFLFERCFMPRMAEFSEEDAISRQASQERVAVSPEEAEAQRTHSEVLDRNRQLEALMQSFEDRDEHEAFARSAVDAVNTLPKVEKHEDGRYHASDKVNDTVDIQRDEHGMYTITPGEGFTGVIKMKRTVGPEEEASYDVLEFRGGVLISGVEGTRGESKIANLEELQERMMEVQVDTVPIFVCHKPERYAALYEKFNTQREELGASRTHPRKVETNEVYKRRRVEMRALEYGIRKAISSNIEAEKKIYTPLVRSAEYYREKEALVSEMTNYLMVQHVAPEDLVRRAIMIHKDKVVEATGNAIKRHKVELQGILAQEESKDHPEYVMEQVRANTELHDVIRREIADECREVIVREELRLSLMDQMKERIPPEEGRVYGAYTEYRDKVIEHIVDTAIKKLPEGLTAPEIAKHKAQIMRDFEEASKKHDAAIKQFLEAQKASWRSPEVGSATGHKEPPITEKVAADVAKYTPAAADAGKKEALDDLMRDLRVVLVDPKKGGIIPASWWSRAGTYWVERDAVADGMLHNLREKLAHDPYVTTEMLHNNREGIIDSAKESVRRHHAGVKAFLDKKENQAKSPQDIKRNWEVAGKEVTDDFSDSMFALVKENKSSEEDREQELEKLRRDMEALAEKNIEAVGKGWRPGKSRAYYVERDAMAAEIVDQTISRLDPKLSRGSLVRDHDQVMKALETSLTEHKDAIDKRLRETSGKWGSVLERWDPGLHQVDPEEKARAVLRQRKGEKKDVPIAEDIAQHFGKAVEPIFVRMKVPNIVLPQEGSSTVFSPKATPRVPGQNTGIRKS